MSSDSGGLWFVCAILVGFSVMVAGYVVGSPILIPVGWFVSTGGAFMAGWVSRPPTELPGGPA